MWVGEGIIKHPQPTYRKKQEKKTWKCGLTLHLFPGGRSGSSWGHRHIGGVRGSGCGMGMGSGDCGTVGRLLGLVAGRTVQLGQCRRRHVSRGDGVGIRVPWERGRETGETKVNMLMREDVSSFLSSFLSFFTSSSCHAQVLQFNTHTKRGIMMSEQMTKK